MSSLPILKTIQIDRKSIIKRNKVVMSPDIDQFITVVAEVAVPGFNAQKLAIYIEPAHLEKLIITYAFEDGRCIAFASCVILKKTDINGNPYVVGKGFPGIRIDVRTSTNPNAAYHDLFQQLFKTMIYHFMMYRIENIDFMYNQFNKLIGDVKKSGFSSSDFMDLTKMNLATIFLAFYKNKGGDMDLLMDELERMNNQVPFYIEYLVTDNGSGINPAIAQAQHSGSGKGIKITRDRIRYRWQSWWPPADFLQLRNQHEGLQVAIRVPLIQ